MKLNKIQGQTFGAVPNKALKNYIKTALMNSDNNMQIRILDNYTKIRDLFGSQMLSMQKGVKKTATIELNGDYLVRIDKQKHPVHNLAKIVKALKGREKYANYHGWLNFAEPVQLNLGQAKAAFSVDKFVK